MSEARERLEGVTALVAARHQPDDLLAVLVEEGVLEQDLMREPFAQDAEAGWVGVYRRTEGNTR